VDKPKIGDSPDANECDSRLTSGLEVSLGSRLEDGRGMDGFSAVLDGKLGARRSAGPEPSSGARWHFLDRSDGCAMARPAGRARQLELGLATVPTMECIGTVGCAAASLSRYGRGCRNPTNDRQHYRPGTSLCSRRKRGTQTQALGRSRGGFSTKIHARPMHWAFPSGSSYRLAKRTM
jgi:hypothetical protein